MRTKGIIKNRNGFTLVELLVAIALFGVLMVAFLSLFMTAFRMTLRAGDRDRTLADISGRVEQRMSDDTYADVDVVTVPGTVIIKFSDPEVPDEDINVNVTTGIEPVTDGPPVTITSYETVS